MVAVYFSKNGKNFMEGFNTDAAARRWAKMIKEQGYQLDGLLEC